MTDREVAGYRLTGWLTTWREADVYRAESLTTGQAAAVLLVGPQALPESRRALGRAAEILQTLAQADRMAVPAVLWRGGLDDGAVALVLDIPPGLSLASWAEAEAGGRLPEERSLRAAAQHARLLALLHQERCSGLDQDPGCLFWDPSAGCLLALNWLTVQVGLERADEDLLAWGKSWYRLWLGSPPPDLVERAIRPLSSHPYWEFLSLGVQTVLERVLCPDPAGRYSTAQALHTDLEQHLRRWEQPPEELIALARREAGDPARALLAADLACRRLPVPPADWLALRAELSQQRKEQGERWLAEAQESLELNRFRVAWELLEQAWTSSDLTSAGRLRVQRWQALTQAAQASLAQIGVLRPVLPELMTAVRLADQGRYEAARQTWDAALALLPADLRPQGFLDLQADLHGHERLVHARRLEEAGEEATAEYQKALTLLRQVSYRSSLAAVIGAVEGHWQHLLEQAHRRRASLRLLTEGQAALERERFDQAMELSEKALGLALDPSEELTRARRLWHLARLRQQVQKTWGEPGREEVVLESLALLRRAFPDDEWGQSRQDQMCRKLLEQLRADPEGPAGWLLRRYFGQAAGVQEALAEAPRWAFEERWKPKFQAAQAAAQTRTPAGLRQAMTTLQTLQRQIDWVTGLTSTSLPAVQSLRQEVTRWLEEVQQWLDRQAVLTCEWEATSPEDRGQRRDILLRAQQAGVELFDEEERQVARLLTRLAEQQPAGWLTVWDRTLALADEARLTGLADLARQGYQAVQISKKAPLEARQYAELALKRLETGGTDQRPIPDPARTWHRLLGQVEQLPGQVADLTTQVGKLQTTIRAGSGRRWPIWVFVIFIIAALGWMIWQAWMTFQIARTLHGLTPGPIPSASSTATATTGPVVDITPSVIPEVGPVSITFVGAPMTMTVSTTAMITVAVQDASGKGVNHVQVIFEAEGGTVDPREGIVQDGVASTRFTAGPLPAKAQIIARVGQSWRGWSITLLASKP